MDEKTLKRLLRGEGAEAEVPGRNCPDEALLSAYVEQGISGEKLVKVEAHVADCEACLGQVAFLARQPAEPATSIAPGAVARARDRVALPPSPWRPLVLRWGPALAGAACVVVVVVAVLRQGGTVQAPATMPVPAAVSAVPARPAEPRSSSSGTIPPVASLQPPAGVTVPQAASRVPPAGVAKPAPPTVRNSAPAVRTLSVASPADNATLARKDLEFRWHAVPGSLYYEIDLVTDDGTSVWHSRVEGTSARPPDEAKLDTGAKYFVWVKAFLAGGESVKSATVSFRVAAQ